MDKDKYYSPPKAGGNSGGSGYGRKVAPKEPYDIDRARDELSKKRSSQKKKRAEERSRRKLRRRAVRIRVLFAAAAFALIVFIVLFLTPLLDIQNISVAGNGIVKTEELLEALEGIRGTNLILLSDKKAQEQLSGISYVESATVSKFLIPPSVRVNVTECKPAAKVEVNGMWLIIDPQMKILSDGNEFSNEKLPRAEGLPISRYRVGKRLELADDAEEKLEILEQCLDTMTALKMIGKIDFIDITSTTNIRFGYDERIDALCGSRIDLERKIRMFNAVVNGSSIAENARGVIDLSTSGKAKYTP